MFEDVQNYIDKQGRFYRFDNEKVLVCKILGAKVETGRFGEETHIEIIDKSDNEEKTISTKSVRLLRLLFTDYKAQAGDWFAIKRFGEGYQTQYAVKKLDVSGENVTEMKDPRVEKLEKGAQVTKKMFKDKEKRVEEKKKVEPPEGFSDKDLDDMFKKEGAREE